MALWIIVGMWIGAPIGFLLACLVRKPETIRTSKNHPVLMSDEDVEAFDLLRAVTLSNPAK